MLNCPSPPAPPAPPQGQAVDAGGDAVPGPAVADNTEQNTPSKRKTKSQQDKDDHFEKILKIAQQEDHPVELALQAIAK